MRTPRAIAALLASAAATTAFAQDATPPAPASAPTPSPTPAAEPTAPALQFRGPDGKPLPPEVEAELRERFKANPPTPPAGGTAAGGGGPGDVVVRGRKPRGAVVGDIPPERTFNPIDIRAYGASTVEELIGALGAQVSSGRGRDDAGPIVLLNGKRVSSFAEIARLPPEAIERMEVFPEELALKYGYRADQKVVNVVAFERFSSTVGQLSYLAPTEGGRDTAGVSGNYLRLRGDTRYNLDVEHSRSGKLLESERGIAQVGGDPSLGRFRTLLPSTDRLTVNGTVAGTILSDVSASLNGRFEANGSEALLGRDADSALARDVDTRSARLGLALGGRRGQWQWSFTGTYDRTVTDTLTDRPGAALRDTAHAVNQVAGADLLVAGPVLALPAGPLSASIRAGVDGRDFDARAQIGGIDRTTDLGRDRSTVQANVDLPITGGDAASPRGLGTLTASANAGLERLSDAGTLVSYGFGLNWTPIAALNLLATVSGEEGAPTVEQLGAPPIVTPNLRTFDFARGETVDITRISGGNRSLRSDDRRVLSLGLTARPIKGTDLTISLDYLDTRIDDPIAAFPLPTTQIEAAFPERFGRDAAGRLQRIDGTPLNFARAEQRQLRWGINLSRPFGEQPPGASGNNVRFFSSEEEARRRLPPGAQVQFRQVEPGSPAARRFENLNSRILFSLQHLIRLEDEVLLRPGVPTLDLLDGGALDARGGRPRHEVELQAGIFRRGLGARLTATWQSGTSVRGLAGADGGAGDLDFGSLATVNLNLFANVSGYLGRAKTPGWASGMRLSLGVANLFNERPDVRDRTGAVPINYQPAYLNPLGRTVSMSLRKVF